MKQRPGHYGTLQIVRFSVWITNYYEERFRKPGEIQNDEFFPARLFFSKETIQYTVHPSNLWISELHTGETVCLWMQKDLGIILALF